MKLRKLLVIVMAVIAFTGTSYGMSLLNKIPAVSGTVLDSDGAPLAGVTVTVQFLGTNDSIWEENKDSYVIKELNGVSNEQGVYELKGCMVNLGNIKGKFIGAEIVYNLEGYTARKVQAVNMRVAGGAIGVFIIGLIDAQGELDGNGPGVFPTVAHAYKTMKDSKIGKVYRKLIEDEPMKLKRLDGEGVKTSQFNKLYE